MPGSRAHVYWILPKSPCWCWAKSWLSGVIGLALLDSTVIRGVTAVLSSSSHLTRPGRAVRPLYAASKQPATRKLLLLISDGKPADYDRYEGRYGIADVRRAIREVHQARIHTYALAVDVQAKLYLPQMFGSENFQILPQPGHLVRGLTDIYRRLSY